MTLSMTLFKIRFVKTTKSPKSVILRTLLLTKITHVYKHRQLSTVKIKPNNEILEHTVYVYVYMLTQ